MKIYTRGFKDANSIVMRHPIQCSLYMRRQEMLASRPLHTVYMNDDFIYYQCSFSFIGQFDTSHWTRNEKHGRISHMMEALWNIDINDNITTHLYDNRGNSASLMSTFHIYVAIFHYLLHMVAKFLSWFNYGGLYIYIKDDFIGIY
jgi:hypothetical protein